MTPTPIQLISALIFALAIAHTFATQHFENLARHRPAHAGLWHLLAEVEVVFGFWALVLMVLMFVLDGAAVATQYIDSRNFTEPMFVFAVMVMAATRPILQTTTTGVSWLARCLPLPGSMGTYVVVMAVVPLLGSLITEPAAMTLGALMLSERFLGSGVSSRFKYATLGVLFVNVSVGGTLTSYAAPPVLMVAAKWGWDSSFMLATLGWKAAVAVALNAVGVAVFFRRELIKIPNASTSKEGKIVPWSLVMVHFGFLFGVIRFAHHPAIFMGLFLFFLGVASAYKMHQDRLMLREGLLVAFFLAGLVVLGGQQQWWLQPVLLSMGSGQVFWGATALTAFTDNAALTYLGSLVEGLSDPFKVALVAGAVTGGGLTVMANAPNPAGMAILAKHFDDEAVHPLGLLAAAALPTLVAALAFQFL
jgi:hypothetical protein